MLLSLVLDGIYEQTCELFKQKEACEKVRDQDGEQICEYWGFDNQPKDKKPKKTRGKCQVDMQEAFDRGIDKMEDIHWIQKRCSKSQEDECGVENTAEWLGEDDMTDDCLIDGETKYGKNLSEYMDKHGNKTELYDCPTKVQALARSFDQIKKLSYPHVQDELKMPYGKRCDPDHYKSSYGTGNGSGNAAGTGVGDCDTSGLIWQGDKDDYCAPLKSSGIVRPICYWEDYAKLGEQGDDSIVDKRLIEHGLFKRDFMPHIKYYCRDELKECLADPLCAEGIDELMRAGEIIDIPAFNKKLSKLKHKLADALDGLPEPSPVDLDFVNELDSCLVNRCNQFVDKCDMKVDLEGKRSDKAIKEFAKKSGSGSGSSNSEQLYPIHPYIKTRNFDNVVDSLSGSGDGLSLCDRSWMDVKSNIDKEFRIIHISSQFVVVITPMYQNFKN